MADYNKKFLDNKFKNKNDKERIINNIIRDFQNYQTTLTELKSLRKEADAYKKALKKDKNFLAGLNVHKGIVTYKAVADIFGYQYISPSEVIN